MNPERARIDPEARLRVVLAMKTDTGAEIQRFEADLAATRRTLDALEDEEQELRRRLNEQ